jgi:hypothetical protein
VSSYDSALSATQGYVDELTAVLARWALRDDTKAQPEVRQAANDAMDAIDGALRELYGLRSRLVDEIRESDDAAAVRIGALLRRTREERGW